MNRYGDRGEIYLLSLDTFMIMAVLGLSLGMIFMILNPAVGMKPADPTREVIYSLTDSRLQEMKRCIEVDFDINIFRVNGPNNVVFTVSITTGEASNKIIKVRVKKDSVVIREEKEELHGLVQTHECLRQFLRVPL